ncbi:MAG: histidine--tRNA ligase [Fusobacteriia bacterium 4572_132]|nr:MAG: histidine--tRNA ligase [Fusobacteriia bacterium 4572_132]
MKLKAIRGTKDIFGNDIFKFDKVINTAKKVFLNFGYENIITPIFEKTELFQRGIGEETDVVEKEMYTFDDKGGRSITLRPEGTASIVRSYLEHKIYGKENFTKYFYYGPMFRYERPQAGRYREFYQVGVETFGENDPALDAEIISMGYIFANKLGINDLEIQINSLGNSKNRQDYQKELKKYIESKYEGLCSDCQRRYLKNPLRVLDCKNEKCKTELKEAPLMIDFLDEESKQHYTDLKRYLSELGVPYIENPKLVRGLDYYTDTVFEIVTKKLGAQGTVLAGGRYNKLLEEIGNKSIPAIGFAAGVERLMLLLDNDETEKKIEVFIAWQGNENKSFSLKMANELRKNDINAVILFEEKSLRAQMKKASKLKVKYVIIIGEEEKNNEILSFKEYDTGKQSKHPINEIIEKIKEEKK